MQEPIFLLKHMQNIFTFMIYELDHETVNQEVSFLILDVVLGYRALGKSH